MRWLLALLAVGGCWRSRTSEPVLANHAEETDFVITSRGVGPFGPATTATEAALQALAPRMSVRTHDLGGESGIVFDVFDGDDRLLYVVPDDAVGWTDDDGAEHRYASTVFAVFAVSPNVRVQGRSWRVGQPFDDLAGIDVCECWGNREVTACFRRGTRIRVIFELPCDDAEQGGARAMLGKPIARLMWKRTIEAAPDVSPLE